MPARRDLCFVQVPHKYAHNVCFLQCSRRKQNCHDFFNETAFISICASTVLRGLTLGYLLIHGAHIKPNFNMVLVSVCTYSLFFIYSHFTNQFPFYSYCLALQNLRTYHNRVIHSLDTANNAEKMKKKLEVERTYQ